jgi:hypothetical protein
LLKRVRTSQIGQAILGSRRFATYPPLRDAAAVLPSQALGRIGSEGKTMHGTLEEILVQLRAGVEVLYGPRLVPLLRYDSQARGEATTESDMNVLSSYREQ